MSEVLLRRCLFSSDRMEHKLCEMEPTPQDRRFHQALPLPADLRCHTLFPYVQVTEDLHLAHVRQVREILRRGGLSPWQHSGEYSSHILVAAEMRELTVLSSRYRGYWIEQTTVSCRYGTQPLSFPR